MKYKYSIIITSKNYDHLDETLDSVINQKYDLNNIEVIILNDNSNEYKDIIKNYNIPNMVSIKVEEDDFISALNKALDSSNGEYFSIIDSDSYYKNDDIFNKIDKYSEEDDLIAISSINYLDEVNKIQPPKSKRINLIKRPSYFNLALNTYFIKKDLVKDIRFDKSDDYELLFLLKLLMNNNTYYFDSSLNILTYNTYYDEIEKDDLSKSKSWYFETIKSYINYFKDKKDIPNYIQEILFYIIYIRFKCNNEINSCIKFTDDQRNEFLNLVKELLSYIANQTIVVHYEKKDYRLFKVPRWLRFYLLNLKMSKKREISIKSKNICLNYDNEKIVVDDLQNENVSVFAINKRNNKLYFDCTTSLRNLLDEDEFKIVVEHDGKEIDYTKRYFNAPCIVFNKNIGDKYCFNFGIDIKKDTKLKVYAIINDKKYPLIFKYAKPSARLGDSKRSFWPQKGFILFNRNNYISIKGNNFFRLMKAELLFMLSKLKNESKKLTVIKYAFLRCLYYITKPYFRNKHIWVTFDKLYKAGDNGEYMYQYGLKHNKDIYYIVKKDSPDYKRLIKQNKKHVLAYASLRQRIYTLNAEVILKTHANAMAFCSFQGLSRVLIRNLFNAEIVEIQHGLTIQDIPRYQHRMVDNIKLYFIASDFEYANIKKPIYDFDKDQIKWTGIPRFDGLKDNDQKIILITPTWRHNIAAKSVKYGKPRAYNEEFKYTEYFRIYNELINNKKLVEFAKNNGYKIVYLLHPTLSSQAEDFDSSEYVDVVPAAGDMNYEKMLTESSLMVTDYSGVQYDFAYMRKPLIYFHPKELPTHYDSGSMDYEKDGLGPIETTIDDVVDKIIDILGNNKRDPLYIERANKFFTFDDYDNCKRITEELDKYLDNIK